MTDIPTLFDIDPPSTVILPGTDRISIDAQFDAFRILNPWVEDALIHLTRDLQAAGHSKVGMKMLFEVLRWQWLRATRDPNSDFKLNNNFTARYARVIMAEHADLDGIYETRTLRTVA